METRSMKKDGRIVIDKEYCTEMDTFIKENGMIENGTQHISVIVNIQLYYLNL